MSLPFAPPPASADFPAELLPALLAVSLTAVFVLHPVYGPDEAGVVDFVVEYSSPAAQRMMRVSEGDPFSLLTRFPQAQFNGMFDFYRRVSEAEEAGCHETNYQAAELDNYFYVVATRRGTRLVVSFTDTADNSRSAVEETLRQSHVREQAALAEAEAQRNELEQVFMQAPVAIAVLRGPRYVIELANPAVCALWGRTPAQALHTPLFELLPEVAGQGFEQLLDGVMTTGNAYVADEMPSPIDRDGRHDTAYWNFVYHPLREADGRISGVAVVATEVSELLRARRELAAQTQLRAVFEQAPVAVGVFTGPEYVVDVCNPGLQAIWGRTAEQALHRPVFEVLPEVRDQGFKELLDEVVRTGVPYMAREVPLKVQRHGQLATMHINFVYYPLRDERGRITSVAAVATDVSEQVAARRLLQRRNEKQVSRLDQELAAANEQLRASNAALEQRINNRTHALLVTLEQLEKRGRELAQALAAEQALGELKSRFVTMASHEFRTPLAVVLTSADLLSKYPGPDQQPQRLTHLTRIRASVQHLNDILEEFLSVGRIEEGKVEAHPAPFDLHVLLADTVADARGTLKAGQTIVQQVRCPAPFRLDASLLRKILVNLLANALKYSGENSVVTVRADCHENVLTLCVQDQGVGISAEDQAHLFERFFRARTVTNVPGTGLGLYIIARYLELMGGTIALTSELHVGTTVTLTIPYENHPAD
ncbi:MAG: PAS domain-containing sensor histidine kinase [Hymenobacter sp.]|nr:PAS domain-containing sensor histidine kinase [Hymenobacter sp.]